MGVGLGYVLWGRRGLLVRRMQTGGAMPADFF